MGPADWVNVATEANATMGRIEAREERDDGASPGTTAAHAAASDDELLLAMRAGHDLAYVEFLRRFLPSLCEVARRAGLGAQESEIQAVEFLDDAALALAGPQARSPRSVGAYLITGFRRRVLNVKRDRARRERWTAHGAAELDGGEAPPDASLMSEHALREARGPEWESAPLPPVVGRLLAALMHDGLTDEERLMLAWASNCVPQREMARWLGIEHDTAGKRLRRLRARLCDVARRHAASLPVAERRELARFIHDLVAPERADSLPGDGRKPATGRAAARHTRSGVDEEGVR